ncbi:DUF3526 domain-containing protein [Eisenibacter elegans]|uniref:DUF3526 domain-containing protein n=1 Tax=Eisenibacter elegans TaxID=997 RepID=UPI0004268B1F|nr:DUF3526 domain-containing protein [Eisenibacter elegans]
MIQQIFRKELAELFQSRRFRVLALGLGLLWAVALLNGLQYYQHHNHTAHKASEASYAQWLGQGEKNPHSAAHYGFYVFKPVPLMAVIERGSSDFLGNIVWLEAHRQNEVRDAAAADAGSLLRMGQLSIGFLLQFIVPLFVILLCYNQFSKEREQNTLKLLLSTRARVSDLFVGKWLASLVAVWSLVLPLLMLTVGLMALQPSGESWVDVVVPALLWLVLGLFLLYALVATVAIAVSAAVAQSATSLVVLAGFWLIGVFLVPRFGAVLADTLYPTPSSFAFDQRIEALRKGGLDGHGPPNQDLLQKTLAKYGVDSVSQLPVNFAAISLQAGEDADAAIYDVVYQDLFAQFRRQERWLRYTALLSPFQAFQNLSMALSNTDVHAHLRFADQAETHRRRMQKDINRYYETNNTGNEEFWASIPRLDYKPATLNERLDLAKADLAALGVWLLLSLVFALFSIRQFKLT